MNFKLMDLANKTVNISNSNSYKVNGEEVLLRMSKKHPVYLKHGTYSATIRPEEDKNVIGAEKTPDCIVQVVKESTVDAVFRFAEVYNERTIGVLNFASAKQPGGGFLHGKIAQEECLSYCSDLYRKQVGQEYYSINAKKRSMYYTDAMIISQVNFFRTSDYKLVKEPVECCVITCPAVNKNLSGDTRKADEIMKNRMRKILKVFIFYKQQHIILGAFGCGVFRNSAATVAQYWKDLLYEEGYIKYFNHISFSVLGDENYNTFKQILK